MPDVMLDLETMGTSPNAAIVAIGAVAFDADAGTLGSSFYATISLESATEATANAPGGTIEPATVLWWMQQSRDARAVFQGDSLHLYTALDQFAGWIKSAAGDDAKVWGNGADFDNVILATAFRRWRIATPWDFRNNRCYRTLKNEHPEVLIERKGTHHNALDDATSQAEHAIAIRKHQAAQRLSAAPVLTMPPTTVILGEDDIVPQHRGRIPAYDIRRIDLTPEATARVDAANVAAISFGGECHILKADGWRRGNTVATAVTP